MAYLCYICSKEFTRQQNLYAHHKSAHGFNKISVAVLNTDNTNSSKEECHICGETIKKIWLLRKHMIENHGLKDDPDFITCFLCQKQYTRKKSLYKHLRAAHGFSGDKDSMPPGDGPEPCEICQKRLTTKYTKLKHMATVHGTSPRDGLHDLRTKCPFDHCSDFLGSYKSLLKHISEIHNIEIEKEETTFTSLEKFEEWKQLYEKRSLSSYVSISSPKSLAGGMEKRTYRCRQSFQYRPSRPCKDPNRTYKTCTSRIEVNSDESGVRVQFWKTHIGHSIGTGKESSELNNYPCDMWVEHIVSASTSDFDYSKHPIDSSSVFNLLSDNLDCLNDDGKEQCEICSKMFTTKYTKRNHMVAVHGVNSRSGLKDSRTKCPLDNCAESLCSYKSLLKHVKDIHNIEIEEEEIEFTSWDEFQRWKETYEQQNSSSYVLLTSARKLVCGMEKRLYKCRHTFAYRASRPCKDTNRTYKTCTSRMEVTSGNNSVRLHFWKTHLGHSSGNKQIIEKRNMIELSDVFDNEQNSVIIDAPNIDKTSNVDYSSIADSIIDLPEDTIQFDQSVGIEVTVQDCEERCEICSNMFYSKYTKLKHMASFHRESYTAKHNLKKPRTKCPVENCDKRLGCYKSLLRHVKEVHGIKIEKEVNTFATWEEFIKWKEMHELSTSSSYVIQKSLYKSVKGIQWRFYKCRHTLNYRPSRPCKDPNRTYTTCTSRMEVASSERCVRVKFWKTHLGHSIEPKKAEAKSTKFKCEVCPKVLSTKYTKLKHMASVHGITNTETQNEVHTKCPVENCPKYLRRHHKALLKHVKEVHNIEIEKEERTFSSWEEFQKWKESYERNTLSCYVVQNSKFKSGNEIQNRNYRCRHTLLYRPSRPCKDTNRTYKICTSRMQVTLSENCISVIFWKTHIGHSVESVEAKNTKQRCEKCLKVFSTRYGKMTHLRTVHRTSDYERQNEARTKCPVENCGESLVTYISLLRHVKEIHNIEIDMENHTFTCWQVFQKWKERYEKDTKSHYALLRSRKTVKGIEMRSYSCFYNYFCYRTSRPTYKTCTSRMEVALSDNGIKVHFWKTHIGHAEGILPRMLLNKPPYNKNNNYVNSAHQINTRENGHKIKVNVQNTKVQCGMCPKVLLSKRDKLKHMAFIHGPAESPRRLISHIKCPMKNCINRLASYKSLLIHLKELHDVGVQKDEISFTTWKDFQIWKQTYEKETSLSYIVQRAPFRLAGGLVKKFYKCHHSSQYRADRPCKNPNKVYMRCTSKMEVTVKKNIVKLQFWKTHIRHNIVVKYSKKKASSIQSNHASLIKCNQSTKTSNTNLNSVESMMTVNDNLIEIKQRQNKSICDQSNKKFDDNTENLLMDNSVNETVYNSGRLIEVECISANISQQIAVISDSNQTSQTSNANIPEKTVTVDVNSLVKAKALSISKLGKINSSLCNEEKLKYLKAVDELLSRLIEK